MLKLSGSLGTLGVGIPIRTSPYAVKRVPYRPRTGDFQDMVDAIIAAGAGEDQTREAPAAFIINPAAFEFDY